MGQLRLHAFAGPSHAGVHAAEYQNVEWEEAQARQRELVAHVEKETQGNQQLNGVHPCDHQPHVDKRRRLVDIVDQSRENRAGALFGKEEHA